MKFPSAFYSWSLGIAAILFMNSSTSGAVITYGPVSYGPATTNWSSSLSLPKWDPALFPGYVLTGVSFSLEGNVAGNASFESLDAGPTTVTMNLQSTITLTDPLSNVLATIIPVANTSDAVTAYDGSIDFGGSSGKSYLGLTGSASTTGSSVNFALFTGSGNIVLPISAIGNSVGTGAGNLITQFSTSADASASVIYTYVAVPEASSMVMMAVGSALLGGIVLRRRRD